MADWLIWDGGALTADVVTSVEMESAAEPTDHPIESGGVITDHFIRQPDRLTVEFCQSRLSLRSEDLVWKQTDVEFIESRFEPSGLLALSSAVGAGLQAAGQALGILSSPSELKVWSLTLKDPDTNRVQEIHDQLLNLLNDSTELQFSYQGQELQGYYLTSVRRSTQAGSGGMSRFTVELREVQTVQTAAVAGLGLEAPSILSAIPLLDLGKKSNRQEVEENLFERSLNANDLGLNSLGNAI